MHIYYYYHKKRKKGNNKGREKERHLHNVVTSPISFKPTDPASLLSDRASFTYITRNKDKELPEWR